MVHDAGDGASDEVPLVIETDENEAQTYVDPPHLDGLDAHHGHEVDAAQLDLDGWHGLQWPTSAFVSAICLCVLAFKLFCFMAGFTEDQRHCRGHWTICVCSILLAYDVLRKYTASVIVGITINREYYARFPDWDRSLGPEPVPRSAAFVFTSTFIFSVGTVAAYLSLAYVYPFVDTPGKPVTRDLIVLVPWTAVGTILIDGYHVPRIRRSLGLL